MIHSLNTVICRIGVFLICARILVHFRPNASYEKYLKLLTSLMILSQFLLPFGNRYSTKNQAFLEDDIWNRLRDNWENTVETGLEGVKAGQMEELTIGSPVKEIGPVSIDIRIGKEEGECEGEAITEAVKGEMVHQRESVTIDFGGNFAGGGFSSYQEE